jgi:hypothetical protein
MIWKGRPGAVVALGLLLDRTYAELAAAGAHPHRMDRPFLHGQVMLWDTHLRPAVAAAGAPFRARDRAARAVWRGLSADARPEHADWLRAHLIGLGIEPESLLGPVTDPRAEPPPGPGPGHLRDLAGLQHHILRRLRGLSSLGRVCRWELAAAGTLCAGLGSETMRIAGGLGGRLRRERAARRRLQTLIADSDGWDRAFLRTAALGVDGLTVPEATGAAPPTRERITLRTVDGLLDGLDFAGARLRAVVGEDPTYVHLDLRWADPDREAIGVIALHVPRIPVRLDIPPDGLALAGRPRVAAGADDIEVTIPLAGGDWTISGAAGTWYVD